MPSLKSRCENSERVVTTVLTHNAMSREEQAAKIAEANRLHEAKVLYVQSGCPKRHTRHWESINGRTSPNGWLEAREKIAKARGSGCLIALLGKRGTGKTQLAQVAIKATCDRLKTALYCVAMDIFLDLRATYGTEASERSVIDHYSQSALLVIDELQERGNSIWEDRVLHHLIDARYRAELDTLLLANLEEPAFKESMGASVTERLNETGGIIECDWESFRK